MTNIPKTFFQLSHIYVGGAMLFNHLRYSKILRVGIHVATSLMAVCDVLLGTLGVSLGRFFLHKETENSSSTISGNSLKTTMSSVSRRYTGRMRFLQAIQVWAPRFKLFGTFILGNENPGVSATCIHKDLLPEDAFVTHVITSQGRDHIVNVQSGRKNLVIVNVHFEPELTLRRSHHHG